MILLLLQILWLESRTPTVEARLSVFRQTYETALNVIAPDVKTSLEFVEHEVYTNDKERAIAITTWTGEAFICRVDWRALYAQDEAKQELVAVHEACHLRDADVLKDLKAEDLSPELRRTLEIRANRCSVLYLATREK